MIRSPRENRPAPHKPAVGFVYRSDGSGRDSYVLQNSGGLIKDFRSTKADNIFYSGLRSHPESPIRQAGFLESNYANWKTPKEKAIIKAHATFQKAHVEKLSPRQSPE